jgi:glycosyltransferase involved in cell wall biosynthesis
VNSSATPSSERLRVLLFTNSIAVGGMEEHVELLAKHLDRSRFEVFSACPEWEAIEPFAESLRAVSDHFAYLTPDSRHGRGKLLSQTAAMTAKLRSWRIDVVHMHSTSYRGQYYALLAAKAAGVKKVFVTEHLAPDRLLSLSERAKRDAFTHLVDGIVCVSQKNYVARSAHLDTPLEKTTVVNNGVDLDDFTEIPEATLNELRARLELPVGTPVVGTVVRFEPEKGLEYLLDAMPAIKAAVPEVRLLMVGDGSLRAELEAHAARLGLADRVRFVGFQKDPRPYLALMDAFVLPVPFGSMSIGLLEAMAMGRVPVITFGGEGEAVVHGECGYCPEPRNPAAIAKFVTPILTDAELRQRLSRAARRRIEEHFSATGVARALEKLYAEGLA